MASERIINEYDSTRIANAVDTLATNLADYSGTTVTPTDAMKAKLPSQTTADRIADALTDIADVAVNGTAYGTSISPKSRVAKSVTTTKRNFKLVRGSKVLVKFAHGSDSSNLTLNVDSTGAKPVYMNGAALEEELEENGTYQFVYNGTQFDLVGGAGGSGGPQTAIIALSATTASVDNATTTATITMTTNSDGTPSVSSSDSSIATAIISNNTITITGVGSGNATVTVSIPATSSYTAAEATIAVTSTIFIPVVGETYKLGSGAHTGGTAIAEATCLAVDTTNNTAIMASNGLYGGTWAGTGELTSAKNTYFGDLADAISGVYLPRGNADGSETTTTPTDIFVYNGSSFVNTYSSEALSVLAGISAVRSNYSSETVNYGGCLGTPYDANRVWFINGSGGVSHQKYATYTFVNAPTFILDLTKVKLHGNLIVDINAADPPTKVSFASATPAQREAIVRAYEAGIIDITEYWSDGEEATATLPAIAASGTGWSVGESQPQQEVTIVLSLDSCKELTTTYTNGQKYSKFLVHQKNGLAETGYMNDTNTNTGSWESSARRAWCNTAYKAAMISAFGDIFHQVKNITAETSSGTTNQTSNDHFALPAAKEEFGGTANAAGVDTGFSNLTEFNALKQFKYYETSANRIKKLGNSGSAKLYFERSPQVNTQTNYCAVSSGGAKDTSATNNTQGIAPFGAI